jgi:hypothetical protein
MCWMGEGRDERGLAGRDGSGGGGGGVLKVG